MNQSFQIHFTVSDIYSGNTIANLARFIDNSDSTELVHIMNHYQKEQKSLWMIPAGNSGIEIYKNWAKAFEDHFNVFGVDNYNIKYEDSISDKENIARIYQQAIKQHAHYNEKEILLVGCCLGGQIGLEMAALWEAEGHRNIKLMLLDAVFHDEYSLSLRTQIDDQYFIDIIQRDLTRDAAGQTYIKQSIKTYLAEKSINLDLAFKSLQYAQVVLFKALQGDNRIEHHIADTMNQYVMSLKDNNIGQICKHLQVVNVDCLHVDTLSFQSEIYDAIVKKLVTSHLDI